jgi:hypothetical protein
LQRFQEEMVKAATPQNDVDTLTAKVMESFKEETPFADLACAFSRCFMRDWIENLIKNKRRKEDEALFSPSQAENSLEELDVHADKLEELAEQIRTAQDVDEERSKDLVQAACRAVSELRNQVAELSSKAGVSVPSWDSADELKSQLSDIFNTLAVNAQTAQISAFLTQLANELRALVVSHRSPREERKLAEQRNDAVLEVSNAAKDSKPQWIDSQPGDPRDWLMETATEQDGELLEQKQDMLEKMGFANLADFIGVIAPDWFPPENDVSTPPPSNATSPSKTDIENTSASSLHSTAPSQAQKTMPKEQKPEGNSQNCITPADFAVPQKTEPSRTDEKNKSSIEKKQPGSAAPNDEPTSFLQGEQVHPDSKPSQDTSLDPKIPQDETKINHEHETEKHIAPQPCDHTEKAYKEPVPRYTRTDMPLAELALLCEKQTDEGQEARSLLTARLVGEGEEGLAYCLSEVFEDKYPAYSRQFPAWIVGSAFASSCMKINSESVHAMLSRFYEQFATDMFETNCPQWKQAIRIMIAAGGIRPALFAPHCGAAAVLRELHLHDLPALQAIIKAVADYGNRGVPLPPSALQSAISTDEISRELEHLSSEAKEWLTRAPSFTIISGPGVDTWRHFVQSNGCIAELLKPVVESCPSKTNWVKEEVVQLSDENRVHRLAQETHQKELKHRGELLTPAKRMILRHTAEAVELAERWLDLVSRKGAKKAGRYNQQLLATLCRTIDENVNDALAELDESDVTDHAGMHAAVVCCRGVLQKLACLLQEDAGGKNTFGKLPHWILHMDWLRINGLPVTTDGKLREIPANQSASDKKSPLLNNLLVPVSQQLKNGLPDWHGAFTMRSDFGDCQGCSRILNLMSESGFSVEELDNLEQALAASIATHQERSQKALRNLQRSLSDGLTKGILTPEQYDCRAVRVAEMERKLKDKEESFLQFDLIYAMGEEVREMMDRQRHLEEDRLKAEITKASASAEDRKRLFKLLKEGDAHTLTDYLARLKENGSLPEIDTSQSDTAFLDFFKNSSDGSASACNKIAKVLVDNSPPQLVRLFKQRNPVLGPDLVNIPAPQLQDIATFVRTWFDVKREMRLSAENAKVIFKFLGFQPKSIASPRSPRQQSELYLSAEPFRDREFCPDPHFGSECNGKYRIISFWERPSPEDMLRSVRSPEQAPVIVLFFGRLEIHERRALARESLTTNTSPVLVIDDILSIYLASKRKNRLRTLFMCTLPFSRSSLYTKSASLLPPEMFFGRKREIAALISRSTDSSCLLYGGRQIGKTVLLRHVKKRFAEGKPESHIACYVDIKAKQIGINRPMDEIWSVIAVELYDAKVLPENIKSKVDNDWLFPRIEDWLAQNESRRILLLLDEADSFLNEDSREEFRACTLFKELMESTSRRFKIVFAGLHNVQRATRVSNNPLAHYGQPICIGPMVGPSDSRDAEALVQEPLAAAGYFFESPDLIARVLAQTNYYPNLIQIYCSELLTYLRQRISALFERESVPPYIITSKMLEDVYERHELRDDLMLRFRWTLELDSRFQLIANILALHSDDYAAGLPVSRIRSEALAYWKQGFTDDSGGVITTATLGNLLEEMVGLGILRRAESADHYALRNPNVVNLIGSRNRIEELLLTASTWERDAKYDPTSFRGLINSEDRLKRSPLTASQESKLMSSGNGITIVYGCQAGGLEDLTEALSFRFMEGDYVRTIPLDATMSTFRDELSKLKGRGRQAATLVVVPAAVKWNAKWLQEASNKISRLKEHRGAVVIVFIADPLKAWHLPIEQESLQGKIQTLSLEPFHDSAVHLWLLDTPHGRQDNESRKKLRELTGNWPGLLYTIDEFVTASDDSRSFTNLEIEELLAQIGKPKLMRLFGLDVLDDHRPLQFLADSGDGWTTADIIAGLKEEGIDISQEQTNRILEWGQSIGLLQKNGSEWVLDSILRETLLS